MTQYDPSFYPSYGRKRPDIGVQPFDLSFEASPDAAATNVDIALPKPAVIPPQQQAQARQLFNDTSQSGQGQNTSKSLNQGPSPKFHNELQVGMGGSLSPWDEHGDIGIKNGAGSGYRGSFQPTSDPWSGDSQTASYPGMERLFSGAGTRGQMEGDFEAHDLINARNQQAMEDIDRAALNRPDPNRDILDAYTTQAAIGRQRALANDPFALENQRANNALDIYKGQKNYDRGIEEDRQKDYMGAMGGIESERNRRLTMLRSSPDYQALDPQKRQAVEDQLNAVFDSQKEIQQGGQQFGERFSPRR